MYIGVVTILVGWCTLVIYTAVVVYAASSSQASSAASF